MPYPFVVIAGKLVRHAARLRGGGSALPGLFAEKVDPGFVSRTLQQLPHGVVVVTGTNGKTTTTKMVVELLESQGLRVFTNRSGSNFVRGVAASLLGAVKLNGKLPADIAVLELDEAHGVHFVKRVAPRYCLVLNVMRDQLDRFGEIDKTAQLLRTIADATTDSVILNREDDRVANIASTLDGRLVRYFGLAPELRQQFPTDDELHGQRAEQTPNKLAADVILESFEGDRAKFRIGEQTFETTLELHGIYNIFNAAAALTLVRTILPDASPKPLLEKLSTITPAFGRGEQFMYKGQPIEFVLVKNPSGFRLSLASFPASGNSVMIAINDRYADGRDMSWLWDVDFEGLRNSGVNLVTGIRAYDMALRLQYDLVPVERIEPDRAKALKQFLASHPDTPKRIFCSYTAMRELRREMAHYVKVGAIE
ncbi:MAG: hypothetical protein JWN33_167 [Candidatus Saccharibacteria bacterium]|nr:hypothetical protein [Candidatus Saccharibacteria bacterium]